MIFQMHIRYRVRSLLLLAMGLFIIPAGLLAQAPPTSAEYAVQLTAKVREVWPPRVTFEWPQDPNALNYKIYRKTFEETNWTTLKSLVGATIFWSDTTLQAGVRYEYRFVKRTVTGYYGFGYASVAIEAPMIEQRGAVILLIDGTISPHLGPALARLEADLVADGWMVLRHDVPRDVSPQVIKKIIEADYRADPENVNSVFIVGHVPVPYSGSMAVDGHSNHYGAWAADAYYGDIDGSWTDNTVATTFADRRDNWNVPGDGRFDQTEIPSDVELAVGRVDFAKMSCFQLAIPPRGEIDLLRAYLDKNHAYRTGELQLPRRAVIRDDLQAFNGEAFAATGWRNFAPLCGTENIQDLPPWTFFQATTSADYLWGYGVGLGSYYGALGLGTFDDFVNNEVRVGFLMLFGSYMGDWDVDSNFLRAGLASGHTLAVMWAGRPHWYLHHMGLGETIGYSTRITQNNRLGGLYERQNPGSHLVHIALLGDPTLRLYPILPPRNPVANVTAEGIDLAWEASNDSNITGYVIYRSTSESGPFERVSGDDFVQGTAFLDSTGGPGHTYMIRAVKYEESPTGTFYNPSPGVLIAPPNALPKAPESLRTTSLFYDRVSIAWNDRATDESYYEIGRRFNGSSFQQIFRIPANSGTYANSGMLAGHTYSYQVRAGNAAGVSPWTAEFPVTLPPAPEGADAVVVASLSEDWTTQGNWHGKYGAKGFNVAGSGAQSDSIIQLAPQIHRLHVWNSAATEPYAPLRSSSSTRVAGCWVAEPSIDIHVNLKDNLPHRVALYMVDYDRNSREQYVELIERSTGRPKSGRYVKDFHNGVYVVWTVKGNITLRVSWRRGANGVVSGVFVD